MDSRSLTQVVEELNQRRIAAILQNLTTVLATSSLGDALHARVLKFQQELGRQLDVANITNDDEDLSQEQVYARRAVLNVILSFYQDIYQQYNEQFHFLNKEIFQLTASEFHELPSQMQKLRASVSSVTSPSSAMSKTKSYVPPKQRDPRLVQEAFKHVSTLPSYKAIIAFIKDNEESQRAT